MNFIKQRNLARQQFRFVKRNLEHIDNQLIQILLEALSASHQEQLKTIHTLYTQQKTMHRTNARAIPERVVSIHQPHVRPNSTWQVKSRSNVRSKSKYTYAQGICVRRQNRFERQGSSERSAVEGTFGEGNIKYGLGRIMTHLKETSEIIISMIFLSINIKRRLRVLLSFFAFGSNIAFCLWIT